MLRDTWRDLSPLLDQALDLEGPGRERWLAELATLQPSAARELHALLEEDARLESGGFLSPEAHAGLLGPTPSLAGQRVGAWVLERPIGRGGMGTVWLARRSDGRFEGSAAVKLLNISLLGRDGEARFRREGSLLARLSHPNIARLQDAGITAGGQPYLVLEYVEGERIDRWSDERRLDLPSRLRLFRQVLDAVGHAHANLVVHRDLKPSNILVDAHGEVKLLDFGIAQLTEHDQPAERTAHAFTPEYASPEQVEGSPVTTGSDVYSLGVLLYLLLTGRHPTSSGEQSPAAQICAVVEREPARASEAVIGAEARRSEGRAPDEQVAGSAVGPGHRVEDLAAARASTPARLRRQLQGDLDTILHKALRKRPGERYATVAALADDIDRHLRHEPVLARPDALGYRVRKFVRRNRVGVAASAIILVTLATATAVTTRQLVVAREQRDLALHASHSAKAKTEFQSFLLTQAGPGGDPLTTEQMLARGRQAIDKRFASDPRMRVELLIDLAGRYLELDDRDTERRVLAEASVLATSIRNDALLAEAECAYARNLAFSGMADSALVQLREARAVLGRVRDPVLELRVDCLAAEAEVQRSTEHVDSAVALLRHAVGLLEEAGATLDTRYGGLLNDLANHLRSTGQRRESIPVLQKTLAILDSLGLGDSQQHDIVAFNTAGALQDLGEYVSARALVAAELRKRVTDGNGAPTMLAYLYGAAAYALAMDDTAQHWLEQAMSDTTLRSAAVNAQLPAVLASVHLRQGRHVEARSLARQSLAAFRKVPDRPESQTLRILLEGRLRRAEGDTRGALDGLRADLRWMGYNDGKRIRQMYPVLLLAAQCALDQGVLTDAERFARDAHEIAAVDSVAVSQSAQVGETSLVLAKVLRARGAAAEALTWASRGVRPLTYGYGAEHPRTIEARALVDSMRKG